MEMATEKQIEALKKFQRNKDLKEIFEGEDLNKITKKRASEMMEKCVTHSKNRKNGKGISWKYSANYRNGNGAFHTVSLTDFEIDKIREKHRMHCKEIYKQCQADFADDVEGRLAVYDKRCDKVFSWIQQALDEKVRLSRK